MKKVVTFGFLLTVATHSPAQMPAAPPAPNERALAGGLSPSVSFLMQDVGISEAEARERIELQQEVSESTSRLQADPAFGGVWLEQKPAFKVVIAFADRQERQSLRDSLSPRLRKYVSIVPVTKSLRQADSDMESIIGSLKSLGLPYEGLFNPRNQKFVISVETDEARGRVVQLLPPQLRGDVEVEIKRLSRKQAPPTGVQSGDWIAGGHTVYTSTTTSPLLTECTFGFPVRYSASRLPGVVTAAQVRPLDQV